MRTRFSVLVLVLLFGLPCQVMAQEGAAATRLLAAAKQQMEKGDLEGALRDLDLFFVQFPGSSYAAEALLTLAEARLRSGDTEGAKIAARELTEVHGRTVFAAEGHFVLAEIQTRRIVSQDDLDAARAAFRNVWLLFGPDEYPDIPWRAAARVRDGELALRSGLASEAASRFVAAVEDDGAGRWRRRALFGFSSALIVQGDWLEAAEVLQLMLDESKQSHAESSDELTVASRWLTLIHRLVLRPDSGERRWQSSRSVSWPGISLSKPIGVAAGEDGNLIVTDQREGVVVTRGWNGSDRPQHQARRGAGRPSWGPEATAMVASDDQVLLPSTRQSRTFSTSERGKTEQVESIVAVERGRLGEWFLLTSKPKRIMMFDSAGTFIKNLVLPERGEPVDLAADQWGRLFVLDRRSGQILRYSGNHTSAQRVAQSGADGPTALTVDLLGNVYVLDSDDRTLEMFASDGRPVQRLGPTLPGGARLSDPVDVDVDGSGRLFVVDRRLSSVVVLE